MSAAVSEPRGNHRRQLETVSIVAADRNVASQRLSILR